MTNKLQRSLVALALGALALPAAAHEVDCSQRVAVALRDPSGGGPLLDPDGLPSLAAPPAVALTVNGYPAFIAFVEEVHNLASAPSVVQQAIDVLPTDPGRVRSFGDTLTGTIPVGGLLRRVTTVAVSSQADCLAAFAQNAPYPAPRAPVCGEGREQTDLVVTTESNIAGCRARVVCDPQTAPPPPPPPPPPTGCVAPAWTGPLTIALGQVTRAERAALTCDGGTLVTGRADGAPADPPGFALILDPSGGSTSDFRFPDDGVTIRVDGAGNLDVAGHIDVQRPVVRQFDPAGNLRWEWTPPYGARGDSFPRDVDLALDAASNVYVVWDSAEGANPGNVGLAKLTAAGAVVWSKIVGLSYHDVVESIAVTPDGKISVAGTTLPIPHLPVTVGQVAFLLHLDTDGTLLWSRTQDDPLSFETGHALAVDGAGHIAFGGDTGGTLDGGAPASAKDAFVAVYDEAGHLLWLRQLRAAPLGPATGSASSVRALAFDASGALWAGGTVTGVLPGATNVGPDDGFVTRWDAAGTSLWARQLAGDRAEVNDVVIDPAGSGVVLLGARPGPQNPSAVLRISPDGK